MQDMLHWLGTAIMVASIAALLWISALAKVRCRICRTMGVFRIRRLDDGRRHFVCVECAGDVDFNRRARERAWAAREINR